MMLKLNTFWKLLNLVCENNRKMIKWLLDFQFYLNWLLIIVIIFFVKFSAQILPVKTNKRATTAVTKHIDRELYRIISVSLSDDKKQMFLNIKDWKLEILSFIIIISTKQGRRQVHGSLTIWYFHFMMETVN